MARIEDVGGWFIHDIGREDHPSHPWQLVIEDGEKRQFDVKMRFVTPGTALDYAIKWAKDRDLTVTMPSGLLRKVVEKDEKVEKM